MVGCSQTCIVVLVLLKKHCYYENIVEGINMFIEIMYDSSFVASAMFIYVI